MGEPSPGDTRVWIANRREEEWTVCMEVFCPNREWYLREWGPFDWAEADRRKGVLLDTAAYLASKREAGGDG